MVPKLKEKGNCRPSSRGSGRVKITSSPKGPVRGTTAQVPWPPTSLTHRHSCKITAVPPDPSALKRPCLPGPAWIWSLQAEGVEAPCLPQWGGRPRDWVPAALVAPDGAVPEAGQGSAARGSGAGLHASCRNARGPHQACFPPPLWRVVTLAPSLSKTPFQAPLLQGEDEVVVNP